MNFAEQVNLLLASYGEISAKKPEAMKLLNTVHKALFGSSVKQGCGDCNYKAYMNIQKHIHLQSQKPNFNLETMKKFNDRNFVIKEGKVLTVGFTGEGLTNHNLTDAAAIDLLTRYPNFLKNFDKYPGSDSVPPALDLSLLTDFDGNQLKDKMLAKIAAGNKPIQVVKKPAETKEEKKQEEVQQKVATPPHKRGKGEQDGTGEENASGEIAQLLPGETLKDYASRTGVSQRTPFRYVKDGKIKNYDETTKAGKLEVLPGAAPVDNANEQPTPEPAKVEPVPAKTLQELLTAEGLAALNAAYNLEEIESDLAGIDEADVREEDTTTTAKFFNGEITDEAELAEVTESLAAYLKEPEGGEASNDTNAPADETKAAGEAAEGAATV